VPDSEAVASRAGAAGPATIEWPVWSTLARLVVTDPAALRPAHELVTAELAAVDRAASRFRSDSEISQLDRAGGRPQLVSPLLAELLGAALAAARDTGGDVDPTVGGALHTLGYDRDIRLLTDRDGAAPAVVAAPAPGWQQVRLDGRTLRLPAGIRLDLGATAKALAADRCAALVHDRLGTGVLVSLGGDIATAGPAPPGGWRVRVELAGDPGCTIAMPAGIAVATSGTVGREWRSGGRLLHHILDPRTCQPVPQVWRTASVAAHRCVEANTLSTAALIRGRAAVDWLAGRGAPARLVAADRTVITTPGWPTGEA
jgi:thiamine biosynthesis lipoprotein